jgi:putative tricarboxylic transport membrane protein
MSDRLLGGFLLLLAVALVVAASRIEAGMIFDSLGPKAFPMLIGVLLGIASLYPLIKPDPEPDWPPAFRLLEIGLAILALVVYGFLLEPLGFVVATALAAAFLSWRLGNSLLAAVPTGIAIAVGIYVIFHLILVLSRARGPWGV